MALTKLTSNLIEGGTGTDWVTAIQTSNFTAEAGKGYFVNTTSQVIYVNLPVGVVGMEITLQDYAGTFATNKVILNANGSEKIQGSALEGKINTNNATAVLIYQDATKGWTSQDVELNVTTISWATPTGQSLTYSAPSPQSSQGAAAATFPTTTFTATSAGSIISGTATIAGLPSGITAAQTITGSGAGNTLTVTLTGTFPSTDSLNTALTLSGLTVSFAVDYLVVAGGGGGGAGVADAWNGGGGGAGGLRTSYGTTSGGGGSSESQALIIQSTNYIVTVGAGGAYGSGSGNTSSSQPGSNGINSTFSTITSVGGGGGGPGKNSSAGPRAFGLNGGSGGGAGVDYQSSAQSGGTGTANQGYNGGAGANSGTGYGGCGGGAGGVGAATAPGYTAAGNALTVAITNNSLDYSEGGGTGYIGTPPAGVSNSGNGGDSAKIPVGGSTASANGGSGVVILRYPNSKTITNPGSGLTFTTATVGSDKVTTFTAGTGNIQLN